MYFPNFKPTYLGYSLLGASNMVRFSLRFADGCPNVATAKQVGLCRSGMTTPEAISLLKKTAQFRGEKVIVLLGTNNVLRASRNGCSVRASFRSLRKDLWHVRRILCKRFRKVCFLTVPPVPRLSSSTIKILNIHNFMMQWPQDENLRVLPLHEVLCLESDLPDCSLFERYIRRKLTEQFKEQ